MIDLEGTDVSSDIADGYLKYTKKKVAFLLLMVALLFALSLFVIRLGATGLSYGDILYYLFHPDGSWGSTVVWDIRLPRVIAAILAGAALGIAGAVMQGILRNPMASPFTLGLSNAAAFGAALAIMFFGGGTVLNTADVTVSQPLVVTVTAFGFAMVATGIVLLLSRAINTTPETVILAGMAISAIFSAGLAFLQYVADDVVLASIVFWQFGSLDKVTWDQLSIIFIVLLAITVYFFWKRWDYNAMEAGEDVAKGLGINVNRTMVVGLILSAMLTSFVVSFMGIIGFIGLIGPHMVKRVIGNDFRYVLAGSMLMGALVLLLSYLVGNYAMEMTIPVGIITSAIGGPTFIYILLRGRVKKCSV